MSSDWPDAQLSTIQKTLQNSWQIPYISLFARIFCDTFQLFDFHQEELEDALLSDNPTEIHPFLQELLISLLSGLTRLHVNSQNMFTILTSTLKRCDLNIVSPSQTGSPSSSLMSISDDTITTADWQEMGIFEKVTVLRVLCDARLNRPDSEVATENMLADSLRFEPFGEDSKKNKYWYFGDTRLYRETYTKNSETSTWECTCRTLDEWNSFIEQFRKPATRRGANAKDRELLERFVALYADLPDIYARKDRERQRRWTSYEPKRSSTRLEAKRQQRLAIEEMNQEQKARHERFLEYKRRQEEVIAKEKERLERSERVRRREERADRIRRRTAAGSSGNIDNQDLSENSNTSFSIDEKTNHSTDTTDIHQRVLTLLRTNENSWPFLEPVTEDLAPNYFTIVENPMDLSTVQKKINDKVYVNNSAEFVHDVELIVSNCEQYNGKRSILGRLANRLLRYFRECWSEHQPVTPQLDDEFEDNPLKRHSTESSSAIVTRDKNNNNRARRNYRQLAGLSDNDDDDEEAEYIPTPNTKRARYSNNSTVISLTIDPNSPAFIVYHDHSYFIRHESNTATFNDTHRRKTTTHVPLIAQNIQIKPKPEPNKSATNETSTTVEVLQNLLRENQQTNRNSGSFTTIIQVLLAKQKEHLSTNLPKDTRESNINETSPIVPPSTAAS